jgi:D-threo-aldose 1-dehydrogenase
LSARPEWPRLGLGCAALGTPPPSLTDDDAQAVIAAAIERGIRFFDVAPLYGGGLAERRLGRALRGLRRDEYILCSKTGVTRPFGETAMPPGTTRRRAHDRWDYSADATRASVRTSLERLEVDRLDVVHLHDVENHLEQCIEAYAELARLRLRGMVGAISIGSNLPSPIERLLSQAPFDAFLLAGCYTLLDQSGSALLDVARARQIPVIAGGVFNSGVLATWPNAAPSFGYEPAPAPIIARTERIARICARHDTPIAAAALQFVTAHPAVTTVLVGPRTVAELDANLAAVEHQIPAQLWSDLEADGLLPAGSPQPVARATMTHPLG